MSVYYANVYEVRQVYGGPEEGGWWYTTGSPVLSEAFSEEENAAERVVQLREEYPDTGYSSSVAPRGADYRVRVERSPATAYPAERPRYE